MLEMINSQLNQIEEFLEEEFEIEIEREEVSTFVEVEYHRYHRKDIEDNIMRNLRAMKTSVEKIEQEEKKKLKHLQDEVNHDKIEKRLEKTMVQTFSNIPSFRELEERIDKQEFEDFVKENVKEMENLD